MGESGNMNATLEKIIRLMNFMIVSIIVKYAHYQTCKIKKAPIIQGLFQVMLTKILISVIIRLEWAFYFNTDVFGLRLA